MVSSVVSKNPYHVRSISLPSRSHPDLHKFEEELIKLKAWESSWLSSASSPAKMICIGLGGLESLYDCVKDLLRLPFIQRALVHHRHEKCVEKVLDGSVRLLDMCGTARDSLLSMKEHARDLQSALRRRREGGSAIKNKVEAYISSRKKVNKDTKRCLRTVKQVGDRWASHPILNDDIDLSMAMKVLMEVNVVTISVFSAILSFMSVSKKTMPKLKSSRWLLVSKAMRKGMMACEGEAGDTSEVESVDVSLYALCENILSKDGDVKRVEDAQMSLEALDVGIEGLEAGSERMFRHLIQTRVSLLNILNL